MVNLFPWLAGTRPGRKLVGWIFAYMSFAIPLVRLRETETLFAFHHPKPAYPFHVVFVPKQAISNLMDLAPSSAFLPDLIEMVQSIVTELELHSYRLIVNGGDYQDFPQLHFHLISSLPQGRVPGRVEGRGEDESP